MMIEIFDLLQFSNAYFFFKHKTAYEMRISDWSSYVCSSDLHLRQQSHARGHVPSLVQVHSHYCFRSKLMNRSRRPDDASRFGLGASESHLDLEGDRKSTRLNSSH